MTSERTKKKVLLVDDDVDFLEQHRIFLESEDFEVISAHSRAEAETILEDLTPDLAILDLMMDETDDGFVLAYHIKKKNRDIPVILVTAVTSETSLEFDTIGSEGSWIKADAMLPKPIRFEQLKREIHRLCKADTI
ncbi:MAG: response regulator [Deltaproteobacteria bacterium]|nr:response regulator [Deltaproteobacteria bacterium]MBN2670503.1 response regulator [Deltaproteobacteria bacterium]